MVGHLKHVTALYQEHCMENTCEIIVVHSIIIKLHLLRHLCSGVACFILSLTPFAVTTLHCKILVDSAVIS